MNAPEISADERYTIRHALGMGPVNASKVAYRNHFCGRSETFEGLVKRGLAISYHPRHGTDDKGRPIYSKAIHYAVKLAAAQAVLGEGESIDAEELAKMQGFEDHA